MASNFKSPATAAVLNQCTGGSEFSHAWGVIKIYRDKTVYRKTKDSEQLRQGAWGERHSCKGNKLHLPHLSPPLTKDKGLPTLFNGRLNWKQCWQTLWTPVLNAWILMWVWFWRSHTWTVVSNTLMDGAGICIDVGISNRKYESEANAVRLSSTKLVIVVLRRHGQLCSSPDFSPISRTAGRGEFGRLFPAALARLFLSPQ